MNDSSQRQVFLQGEGDSWFTRNFQKNSIQSASWIHKDLLLKLIENLPLPLGPEVSVLEVGCGQGLRMAHLSQTKRWTVTGVDPSSQAIEALNSAGLAGMVGTAETLPLPDNSIDLLIYGFCLYLCDRDDLFKIAAEAHRVLKPQSWLAIFDFWSPYQSINKYHHCIDVHTFKDDIPAMFTWHPSYVITDHHMRHHSSGTYTDEAQEWVAATILRRQDLVSSNHDD